MNYNNVEEGVALGVEMSTAYGNNNDDGNIPYFKELSIVRRRAVAMAWTSFFTAIFSGCCLIIPSLWALRLIYYRKTPSVEPFQQQSQAEQRWKDYKRALQISTVTIILSIFFILIIPVVITVFYSYYQRNEGEQKLND